MNLSEHGKTLFQAINESKKNAKIAAVQGKQVSRPVDQDLEALYTNRKTKGIERTHFNDELTR